MATSRVFVILGAGASADCGSSSLPLTTGLFETASQSHYLNLRHIATPLADAMQVHPTGPADGLESYLREEMRTGDDDGRRAYVQVPLFLQELIWNQGHATYNNSPANYQRLVRAVRHFGHVVYITLNWDLVLDHVLFDQSPAVLGNHPTSLADYVQPNWSLIHLHGCVIWGRRIVAPEELLDSFRTQTSPSKLMSPQPPDYGRLLARHVDQLRQSDDVSLLSTESIVHSRYAPHGGQPFPIYPLMAMPLGGVGEEIMCPPDHLKHLQSELADCDVLNLVIIGYSAKDRQIPDLLHAATADTINLAIVDPDRDTRARVVAHVYSRVLKGNTGEHDSFTKFVRPDSAVNKGSRLADWVRKYR